MKISNILVGTVSKCTCGNVELASAISKGHAAMEIFVPVYHAQTNTWYMNIRILDINSYEYSEWTECMPDVYD